MILARPGLSVLCWKLLIWCTRIGVAAYVGICYEQYWFSKKHLLGYLWILNQFKIKGSEVDATLNKLPEKYPLRTAIWVNTAIAILLWFLLRRGILRQKGMWEILWHAFWYSLLFYLTQVPVMFMTGLHWQPHLHNHIHTMFLIFGMMIPLQIKRGWKILRFQRWCMKKLRLYPFPTPSSSDNSKHD